MYLPGDRKLNRFLLEREQLFYEVPRDEEKYMPHKTLSTTGKTENTDRQGCEKKGRQTLSTFCLDFGWIRGDGIEGLQRADWIEASQRAKNARKGA